MSGGSEEQIVAYKYYEDQHVVLALSNFDFISRISFANKVAWEGKAEGADDAWTEIEVFKPGLFGGEDREGGVSGTIHLGMGWPNQPILSRMVSRIGGALMPAYRGVVSLFFDDFYFGNNPYIKEFKIRAQSIHKLSDGSPQWYDKKAEIAEINPEWGIAFQEDFSGTLDAYVNEAPANIYIDNGVLHCDDYNDRQGEQDLHTTFPTQQINWGSLRFRMIDDGIGDQPRVSVPGFITVWPQREQVVDASQRCYINNTPVGDSKLQYGVWYRVDIQRVGANAEVSLYNEQTNQVEATLTENIGDNESSSISIGSGTDGSDYSGGMAIEYDDIEFFTVFPTADINPIHFIRECHTDQIWGGRYPESKMGDSYKTAADQIWDEQLGVSFLFTEEIKWREIIEEVARHIDAIPYQDPDTGLMEIKLIRDDYEVETLPVLDPSNSDLERINDPFENEIFNSVIIEFWNKETGENDSITLSDAAAVDMVGFINSKTYSYSGITNKRTATIVGNRDLARSSRPYYQGRVKTNRAVANLKPGDVFLLKSPEDGIEQIICRVTKRSESGLLNGDITLEFGEDIFGQVMTTFSQPSESVWVDPIGDPRQFSYQTAFEIPYYLAVQAEGDDFMSTLADGSCFYGFAGVSPIFGAHLNYNLYVYPDGVTQEPDTEFAISCQFTPVGVVSVDVDDQAELTIPVEALSGMDSVRVGHLIMVGDNLDADREWMVLDAEAADGDTEITVRRGLIDTTPKPITAGTPLYFVGTFFGGSETEYISSEVIEGYGTPKNGLGSYLGPYEYHDLTMAGRIFKPYPPGDLRLDNLPLPVNYSPTSDSVVLTWHHRDRVTQSDQNIDFFDTSDYGPEASTTYRVEADSLDSAGDVISANWFSSNVGLVLTYTLDLSVNPPPAGTVTVKVKVWTVRDGEDSLQPAEAYFNVLAAPSGVAFEYQAPTAPSGLTATEV